MKGFQRTQVFLFAALILSVAGCGSSNHSPTELAATTPTPDDQLKSLQDEVNVLKEELKQTRDSAAQGSTTAPTPAIDLSPPISPPISNEQYQATLDQINDILEELKGLRDGTAPVAAEAPASAPLPAAVVPEPTKEETPVADVPAVKEPAAVADLPAVKEPDPAPIAPVVKEPDPVVKEPAPPPVWGAAAPCVPQTDAVICRKILLPCGGVRATPADFKDQCGNARSSVDCGECRIDGGVRLDGADASPAVAGGVRVPGLPDFHPPLFDGAGLGGLRRRSPPPGLPRIPTPSPIPTPGFRIPLFP